VPPPTDSAAASPPAPDERPMLAAVDLGSNSFRMVVAAVDDGHLERVDSLREGVRLAGSLGPDGRLDAAGEERALACLRRFGERLRHLPPENVRAVGTNTLRRARDVSGFLARAREALGFPVEVISGREEARLIYQGVAHDLGPAEGRRLVVDIGGGSTECALGTGALPERLESLYMGCVGMTLEHFAGGRIRRAAWNAAELAARVELEGIAAELRSLGWQSCAGSSGTVRAAAEVVFGSGWGEELTLPALLQLRQAMLAAGDVAKLELPGLSRDRAAVFPGGVAILLALFRALGIQRMVPSAGSLREGVLRDLVGRLGHDDERERTIARLAGQYGADGAQAARVEATALRLLAAAEAGWALPHREARDFLAWAARTHEIGLAVAHGGHHKHGAYLLGNADLPGFSLQEQRLLALLVRGHRRKLPLASFDELAADRRHVALRLAVLLRLAVVLHRGRVDDPAKGVALAVDGAAVRLALPPGWRRAYPLTLADLEREAVWLRPAGFTLEWSGGKG
jgi:exopolyphosphatase/guanosine-5'-triphosphate,3'-diphosphate pyrophosphatase